LTLHVFAAVPGPVIAACSYIYNNNNNNNNYYYYHYNNQLD